MTSSIQLSPPSKAAWSTVRPAVFAAESAANEVVEQAITPETRHAPRVWGIAWQTRSVAWLIRNRRELEQALA